MAKSPPANGLLTAEQRQFIKAFESILYKYDRASVFGDFVTSNSNLISAAMDKLNGDAQSFKERMTSILSLSERYDDDFHHLSCELYGLLLKGLESRPFDFLGPVYQHLEIADSRKGQFFTPATVCDLMAQIVNPADTGNGDGDTGDGDGDTGDGDTGDGDGDGDTGDGDAAQGEYYSVICDPCAGSGGLLIAAANRMLDEGKNPQQLLYCHAIDISNLCCYMTHLQLSLLHLPATVVCADALDDPKNYRFYLHTPAHHAGMWGQRHKRAGRTGIMTVQTSVLTAMTINGLMDKNAREMREADEAAAGAAGAGADAPKQQGLLL